MTASVSRSPLLEQRSALIADKLRQCFAPADDHTTILELTAQLNGLPLESLDPANPDHPKLLALMLDAELRADSAAGPDASLIDRLLRAQDDLRGELTVLQNNPAFPIDQLRVFDYEEDADDASVRVLKSIGDDPAGIGDFFLAVLPPKARETCKADVTAGRPIRFGRFIDTHPSLCWRYYHAKQFAKALNSCTETPTDHTMPKGSGRPSIVDSMPRDMVESGYGRGPR